MFGLTPGAPGLRPRWPAQPDRVVHIVVENEAIEAPVRGGGDAHSCLFARTG